MDAWSRKTISDIKDFCLPATSRAANPADLSPLEMIDFPDLAQMLPKRPVKCQLPPYDSLLPGHHRFEGGQVSFYALSFSLSPQTPISPRGCGGVILRFIGDEIANSKAFGVDEGREHPRWCLSRKCGK